MSVAAAPSFTFESTYADALAGLSQTWTAMAVPDPRLLALNAPLAAELGADPAALRAPGGVALLAGNAAPAGVQTVALAYAGHQFGGFQPRLGDGRALLLGEVLDVHGRRRDLHLKGSGRTPYARGGDGKAAVGPMLREYVIGEFMHACAIPTTRALAVVATGEAIERETTLPGAVLTRVAASHIRVGTFQYAAVSGGAELVQRLADYAIARHYPLAAQAENPYLDFYERVLDAQASLVARWMLVGFIHGVMNTDNMAISGETIDYGPCAFMDAYDPATVFSSIDHAGRYAYENQPAIAQWNLARLAETLLPLLDGERAAATAAASAVLESFPDRYLGYWRRGMRAKLGLAGAVQADDAELAGDLLALMRAQRADYTSCLRALSASLRGDDAALRALLTGAAFEAWSARWRLRVAAQAQAQAQAPKPALGAAADAMDRLNPVYIPRNHLVEDALAAATDGDLGPFQTLVEVLAAPFTERPGRAVYAAPAPASFGACYQTFCGT